MLTLNVFAAGGTELVGLIRHHTGVAALLALCALVLDIFLVARRTMMVVQQIDEDAVLVKCVLAVFKLRPHCQVVISERSGTNIHKVCRGHNHESSDGSTGNFSRSREDKPVYASLTLSSVFLAFFFSCAFWDSLDVCTCLCMRRLGLDVAARDESRFGSESCPDQFYLTCRLYRACGIDPVCVGWRLFPLTPILVITALLC